MKSVWNIFKKYYLIDLIIYGGVLFIFGYRLSKDNSWGLKYNVIFFGLFIPLLVLLTGSFDLVKYEILRSKKIRDKLSLMPFLNFEKIGFTKNNNELIGQIDGYYVCVGIEWENYQKKPTHYFKVLFNPISLNRYITFSEFVKFNEIIQQDGFYISLNRIEKNYSNEELTIYHYRDILREITKMIDFLKIKNLNSVKYDIWQNDFSDAEEVELEYLSKT